MSFELPTQRRLKLLRGEDPGKPEWYDRWQENLEKEELTLDSLRRNIERIRLEVGPIQHLGRIPVRQELTVLPADNPNARSLGFSVYEMIGIGVSNSRGLTSLVITDD